MPPEETDDTERGGDDDDEDRNNEGSGLGPGINPIDHNYHPDTNNPNIKTGIPGSKNDEDNRLHPSLDSNSNYNSTNRFNSANNNRVSRLSLNRAIFTYVMPVVVMWFGSAINEWLQ